MHTTPAQIILASQSPRRKALLEQVGIDFTVHVADVDESVLPNERADLYIERVAKQKAQVIADIYPDSIIIAADTTVCLGQDIFAKPLDFADACRMWQAMSDTQHQVKTCIVLQQGDQQYHQIITTQVTFKKLNHHEMQKYWETGEPQDKAGGYAIQGRAAAWVKHIQGSYSNVVGLPLFETLQLLEKFQATS
ncbi:MULTISPECIES: Maf family protein [unclassified Acinetobacter]|uniref:Maf family protein n=1 Tax=unclassified Acinetobacter TaxID=196816 RepID=UPI0035B882DD